MASRPLDDRLGQFTALSAAQRALSRSIHPAELAPLREQSRALVIELCGLLGSNASEGKPNLEISPAILDHVDRALAEQTQRTLAVIDQIDMQQLRATVPLIAHQHPEEVGGLVDLLLGGGLDSDKHLRTLEFLITLLSAEEYAGRRRLKQDPAKLTTRLAAMTQKARIEADFDWVVAERMLEEATAKVLQGADVGEIRDRVRRCKEEFGDSLLHPSVLTASVKYNIAMWNNVAAEIDSSRSIDEMATDLFAEMGGVPVASSVDASSTMIDSREFVSLVETLSARVRGEAAGVGRFDRCIDRLDVASMSAERIEDFADENPDESTSFVRAATLMGLVLQDLPENAAALESAGLDPEEFATRAYDDLAARMGELARKHIAAGADTDAFRLQDVKTHELTVHRGVRNRAMGEDPNANFIAGIAADSHGGVGSPSSSTSWTRQLIEALPSGPVMIGLLALIPLVLVFMAPSIIEDTSLEQSALQSISPFLVSGLLQDDAGQADHFVARVADTWAYLGTNERRQIALEIGQHMATMGATQVTLLDSTGLMVVRYVTGDIVILVPHPDDASRRR